jgi:hypothetical protein
VATSDRIARSARPSGARRATVVALIVALLAIVGAPLHAGAPSAQAAPQLKAVIIVGPSGDSTEFFLDIGAKVASQAEGAGMNVVRIFHPHATTERVQENIQGASFVLYLGHGNGWPSPYAPFQERTKNGFGLNKVDGGDIHGHIYRGANWIRSNVKLADHAVVMLIGACYASGNGEPGMPIPSQEIARQRVDNFASGFLAVGAGAVYAFGWVQRANYPEMLMTSNKTVDEIFMTRASGSPAGWVGWNDKYIASERTPGARLHLDPHPSYGYYRALSGDMDMTAAQFRGGEAPPAGDGDELPPAADITAPSVPSGLAASADSSRKVSLSWEASTDDSGSAVKYRVIRNGRRVGTVSATSFSQTLSADGTYRYQLAAVDAAGNVSARSTAVSVEVAKGSSDASTTTLTAPSAPRRLATESLGYREVQLRWLKPTNEGAGNLRYVIFRNGTKIATTRSLTFVDRPDRARTYSYQVRAKDAAGKKSPLTNEVEGTAVKGAIN